MTDRFSACLAFVLRAEGGFVCDPRDEGGATNCGVTIGTLAEYLGRPVDVNDVRDLTPAKAAPIYERLYWSPICGDKLPPGVDLMCFDAAVNMGVGTAARMLQAALGVPEDGQIGPQTLAAPGLTYPKAVLFKLNAARAAKYRSLSTFPVFGKGWLARLANVTAQATKDATA